MKIVKKMLKSRRAISGKRYKQTENRDRMKGTGGVIYSSKMLEFIAFWPIYVVPTY